MKPIHRIATIRFFPGENVGAMRCTCGETMATDTFTRHRAEHGLRSSGGGLDRLRDFSTASQAWLSSARRGAAKGSAAMRGKR